MDKSIVLALLLIMVIFLSGCISQCASNWNCSDWNTCIRTGKTSGVQSRTCTDLNNCNTSVNKPAESQTCELPATATKELSQMALNLSDFPSEGNWTLRNRGERVKSDVSIEAQTLGWIRGYQVAFTRIGTGQEIWGIPTDISRVDHIISVYPIENISKVLTIPYQSTENITFDELSKPNIGDDSRAFRITSKETSNSGYRIEFVKMDIYMALDMSGLTLDYEFLKDLATKAVNKIS